MSQSKVKKSTAMRQYSQTSFLSNLAKKSKLVSTRASSVTEREEIEDDFCFDGEDSSSSPISTTAITQKSFGSTVPGSTQSESSQCDFSPPGYIFAVFFPFILDENYKIKRQPIMFSVKESFLFESGFSLPFVDYENLFKNNFELKIKDFTIYGKIIATGKTPLDLKASLETSLRTNINYQSSDKMIGNVRWICELIHKPLFGSFYKPKRTVLDTKAFQEFKEKISSLISTGSSSTFSQENSGQVSPQPSQQSKEHKGKERPERDEAMILTKKLDNIPKDARSEESSKLKEKKNIGLEKLKEIFERLVERKKLLSAFDVNGSTIVELIDATKSMFHLLLEKDIEKEDSLFKIEEVDKTYKSEVRSRIFLEGKLELDLHYYRIACMKFKPQNPSSLAYQIVKIAFPEQYYLNVSLGKRFLDTYNSKTDSEKKISGMKYTLPYVLGFEDPFNKPFEGESDIIRGHERVRALIEHIFRKSNIMEYDLEMENKIRERLAKVLFQRNKEASLVMEEEKNEEEITEEDFPAPFSKDIWDETLFN